MGRVGGLASSFLASEPGVACERVAEIVSGDNKPWVSYADGVVKSVSDTYGIFYSKKHRLLVFTGESQPQDPAQLYLLCNTLLDYARSAASGGRIRRLYGAGGYLRDQLTGAPRVYGVVNRPELKKVLAEAGIDLVGNEISSITWFNGVVLGLAAARGIDAVGLFGEIAETTVPQPLAAKSILSAFSRLEKIPLDTKQLDRQYESVMEKKKEPSIGPA
jgi:proteasome assembly chaperone (PAC2) family protein